MDKHTITIILAFVLAILLCMVITTWWRRSDPYIEQIRNSLVPVDPLFAQVPIERATSSYTDKNVIYLCSQDKDGKRYDANTLRNVLIHELAHVKSNSFDPTHNSKEFKQNEADLLARARQMGLWNPAQRVPCNYCGMKCKG